MHVFMVTHTQIYKRPQNTQKETSPDHIAAHNLKPN